jgi:streptogrisin C
MSLIAPTVMTISPAQAAPSIPHTTLDPDSVRESMIYLQQTYGVSEAEALRRLELQADASVLQDTLLKEQPDSYAGMGIDQDNGGVLIVSATDVDKVAPYLSGMADRSHVKSKSTKYSLKRLWAERDRLTKQLKSDESSIFIPAVSAVENKVILERRDWVAQSKIDGTLNDETGLDVTLPATATERQSAVAQELALGRAAIKADPADLVEERALAQPSQLGGSQNPYIDWGYCHPLYCSTTYGPMRGGLRLNVKRDDGSWGGCTSGFNVRSTGGTTYNNWAWVLTAGHCVVGKTNNTNINHNGYSILKQHPGNSGLERNSYPYDYAFLPYLDGTTSAAWLDSFSGKNRVMKYCRNGGQDSDSDTPCGTQATTANVYVTGYHTLDEINAYYGFVVCATGTASSSVNYADSYWTGHNDSDVAGYLVGTRCGKTIQNRPDNVSIWTDICARPGDSGGPLFSQVDNTAYGILEGNLQSRTGACYSGEENNYIALSTIYAATNNVAGATYRVITSSTG